MSKYDPKYDPRNYDHCQLYKVGFQAFIERGRINAIRDEINEGDSLKILDAGCGHGDVLAKILTPRHSYTGLEINANSVKICEKKFVAIDNVKFCEGNMNQLAFPDESFDAIICSEVLEHCPDPNVPFKELVRVLKKKGKMIITVPFEKACIVARLILYPIFKPLMKEHYTVVSRTHISPFDKKRLNEMLKNQLSDVRVSRIMGGFKILGTGIKSNP